MGKSRELRIVALALVLLLGAGAATASTVVSDDGNASAILGLEVDGTLYDVRFLQDTAEALYGAAPGEYDFDTLAGAEAAMDAVNLALNDEPDVNTVGPALSIVYGIPYDSENDFVIVREALYVDRENEALGTPAWLQRTDSQGRPFRVPKTFARFFTVPEPTTALLLGLSVVVAARAARRGAAR